MNVAADLDGNGIEGLAAFALPGLLEHGHLEQDPAPATSPAGLAELLASPHDATFKAAALTRALRERQPGLAASIRARLAVETDPALLCALASTLACCGRLSDAPDLEALLLHADPRVTACAVEALFRLRVPVTSALVARVLTSGAATSSASTSDASTALATARGLLSTTKRPHALAVLAQLTSSADPAVSGGSAMLAAAFERRAAARKPRRALYGSRAVTFHVALAAALVLATAFTAAFAASEAGAPAKTTAHTTSKGARTW